jgi:hypothetical protein
MQTLKPDDGSAMLKRRFSHPASMGNDQMTAERIGQDFRGDVVTTVDVRAKEAAEKFGKGME